MYSNVHNGDCRHTLKDEIEAALLRLYFSCRHSIIYRTNISGLSIRLRLPRQRVSSSSTRNHGSAKQQTTDKGRSNAARRVLSRSGRGRRRLARGCHLLGRRTRVRLDRLAPRAACAGQLSHPLNYPRRIQAACTRPGQVPVEYKGRGRFSDWIVRNDA